MYYLSLNVTVKCAIRLYKKQMTDNEKEKYSKENCFHTNCVILLYAELFDW